MLDTALDLRDQRTRRTQITVVPTLKPVPTAAKLNSQTNSIGRSHGVEYGLEQVMCLLESHERC